MPTSPGGHTRCSFARCARRSSCNAVWAALAGASAPATAHASATPRGLVVDASRFFPVMLIDQCTASGIENGKALGINVVVNENCPGVSPDEQLGLLHGCALAVLPIARTTHARRRARWVDVPGRAGQQRLDAGFSGQGPPLRAWKRRRARDISDHDRPVLPTCALRLGTSAALAIRRVRPARRHGRVRSLSAERLPVGSRRPCTTRRSSS